MHKQIIKFFLFFFVTGYLIKNDAISKAIIICNKAHLILFVWMMHHWYLFVECIEWIFIDYNRHAQYFTQTLQVFISYLIDWWEIKKYDVKRWGTANLDNPILIDFIFRMKWLMIWVVWQFNKDFRFLHIVKLMDDVWYSIFRSLLL